MKTLDDLIENGRRLYYAESLTLKETSDKLVSETLDEDAERAIRWHGIHELVRKSVNNDRRMDREGEQETRRPPFAYTPQGKEGQASYATLSAIHYEGADGKPRPILHFTTADWHRRIRTEQAVAQGAVARRNFAQAALTLLEGEGKEVTSELSPAALEALETGARTVFRAYTESLPTTELVPEIDETLGGGEPVPSPTDGLRVSDEPSGGGEISGGSK